MMMPGYHGPFPIQVLRDLLGDVSLIPRAGVHARHDTLFRRIGRLGRRGCRTNRSRGITAFGYQLMVLVEEFRFGVTHGFFVGIVIGGRLLLLISRQNLPIGAFGLGGFMGRGPLRVLGTAQDVSGLIDERCAGIRIETALVGLGRAHDGSPAGREVAQVTIQNNRAYGGEEAEGQFWRTDERGKNEGEGGQDLRKKWGKRERESEM